MGTSGAQFIADLFLCNRRFWWRFFVVVLHLGFFFGCRCFCHRTDSESDLFPFLYFLYTLNCYERMICQLHKSKRYGLIYLSIFLQYSHHRYPWFLEKYSWHIYTQQNFSKAYTSDKETSFLDLKLLTVTFIPTLKTNAIDFGFPNVNFLC